MPPTMAQLATNDRRKELQTIRDRVGADSIHSRSGQRCNAEPELHLDRRARAKLASLTATRLPDDRRRLCRVWRSFCDAQPGASTRRIGKNLLGKAPGKRGTRSPRFYRIPRLGRVPG